MPYFSLSMGLTYCKSPVDVSGCDSGGHEGQHGAHNVISLPIQRQERGVMLEVHSVAPWAGRTSRLYKSTSNGGTEGFPLPGWGSGSPANRFRAAPRLHSMVFKGERAPLLLPRPPASCQPGRSSYLPASRPRVGRAWWHLVST